MSAVLMKPERAQRARASLKLRHLMLHKHHQIFTNKLLLPFFTEKTYPQVKTSRCFRSSRQNLTSLSTVFFINTFLNRAANLDILGRSRLYSVKAQIRFSRAQVSYIPLRLKITLFFVPLCFASSVTFKVKLKRKKVPL